MQRQPRLLITPQWGKISQPTSQPANRPTSKPPNQPGSNKMHMPQAKKRIIIIIIIIIIKKMNKKPTNARICCRCRYCCASRSQRAESPPNHAIDAVASACGAAAKDQRLFWSQSRQSRQSRQRCRRAPPVLLGGCAEPIFVLLGLFSAMTRVAEN